MARQILAGLERDWTALAHALEHLAWAIEAMPDEEAGRAYAEGLANHSEDLAALSQEGLAHAIGAGRAVTLATRLARLAGVLQSLNALRCRFDQAFRYPEAVHDLRQFEDEHPDWQGWVEGVRDARDRLPETLDHAERSLEACFRDLASSIDAASAAHEARPAYRHDDSGTTGPDEPIEA